MSEPLVIDFAKLLQDAKAGAAWPIGDYDMEVVEADSVLASTGSPMVKAKLRVLIGPYANKTMINNFVLSIDKPAALHMFFKQMRALGIDDSYIAGLGSADARDPNCLAPIAAALRGKRARFTNDHRVWQGVTQNNITNVSPITEGLGAGGPVGAPMPASTVAGPSVPQPQFTPPPGQAPPAAPNGGYAAPQVPPTPPAWQQQPAPQPQPAPAPTPAPPAPPQPTTPPAPGPTPAPAPPQPAAPPQQVAPPVPPGYEAVWGMLSPEQQQGILSQLAATVPPPPAPPV